ncbi:MAG: spore coat protein U-like protein [Paraglaciecola sp.]|jgi:spore coat protein U-like protein
MKNKYLLLFASSFYALVSSVNATTDSGVLEVTTTVNNSCSIDAMGRIDFGEYDPSAISTSTTGTSLNITCNGSTVAWRIHSTQSVVTRMMTRVGGAETLIYTLLNSADTAFAVTDTTGSAIGTGTGVAIIKGAIAAGQNVVPGTYTQQIALTIVF